MKQNKNSLENETKKDLLLTSFGIPQSVVIVLSRSFFALGLPQTAYAYTGGLKLGIGNNTSVTICFFEA